MNKKPFPSGNWHNYETEGIYISKKSLKTYFSYIITDSVGNKVKFNYNNSLNAAATFFAPDMNRLGTVTILTPKEITTKHAGQFKFRIKLSAPIQEEDLILNIVIPSAKFYGLITSSFYPKNGESPAGRKEISISGFRPHIYSTPSGKDWWAYTNYKTGEIWVSSSSLGWHWKMINAKHEPLVAPWNLDELELSWLTLVVQTTRIMARAMLTA